MVNLNDQLSWFSFPFCVSALNSPQKLRSFHWWLSTSMWWVRLFFECTSYLSTSRCQILKGNRLIGGRNHRLSGHCYHYWTSYSLRKTILLLFLIRYGFADANATAKEVSLIRFLIVIWQYYNWNMRDITLTAKSKRSSLKRIGYWGDKTSNLSPHSFHIDYFSGIEKQNSLNNGISRIKGEYVSFQLVSISTFLIIL